MKRPSPLTCAHFVQGQRHLEVGNVRRAVAHFASANRSIAARPPAAAVAVAVRTRLGYCFSLMGQHHEAERAALLALDAARESAEPALRSAAASCLGLVLKEQGRYAEAATSYGTALTELGAVAPGDHARRADLSHNLAGLAHAQQRWRLGEGHIEQALAWRAVGGEQRGAGAAGDLGVRGALLLGEGRTQEAHLVLDVALRIWIRLRPVRRLEIAEVQRNLAALHGQRRDFWRGRQLLTTALATKRQCLGSQHRDVVAMATILRAWGGPA